MDLSLIPEVIDNDKNLLTANPGLSYFDWRTSDKVTPVKNQDNCGSCWAFGTISAVESRVLIGESTAYDFSEQNLVCCTDPSFVYLTNDRCHGCWSSEAADTLIKKGTRLESCQPYNIDTIYTESCYDSCPTIKMLNGYRLVTNNGS
jgi:C1A family cysteine protease